MKIYLNFQMPLNCTFFSNAPFFKDANLDFTRQIMFSIQYSDIEPKMPYILMRGWRKLNDSVRSK